jgi:serine/threonine-protein kinase RsbW
MVLALRSEAEGVLPIETLFRFELAVSEALANLAKHARPVRDGATVDLVLDMNPNHTCLEIYDPTGVDPFDSVAAAPDISDVALLAESGRGLGLIMTCADSVTYGEIDGRNSLTLCFSPREDQTSDRK